MIISFTGHRPEKIGGYKLPNPTYISICQKIEAALKEIKPKKAISGMALGIDQWAASICVKLGIPFIAAIPFIGQEGVWPAESKKIYKILLAKAESQHVVSEGGYSAHKLQIRNEWMVNNSDMLVALYNGDETGGTANCVKFAESVNKKIYRIDPRLTTDTATL